MNESAITEAPKGSLLEPMNLHNSTEFDEMLRQRVICGWDSSSSDLEAWRADADAHNMAMFWVVPTSLSHLPVPQRFVGHIMMVSKTEPAANGGAEKPTRHIFNLFVLPEHRRGGLGGAAIRALEAWAKIEPYGSPECTAMTLNSLSRRYIEDDGEEWRGMYARVCENLGIELSPKGKSNEDWYTKMGYVKLSEKPTYPVELDGKKILLNAVSMRKPLA
jgi:GNAT superfamily N-acetyltransferase